MNDAAPATREQALITVKVLRERYRDKQEHLASFNEAKTRLLLVDEVLQALGWPKDNFNPEHATRSGFIDYLLSVDNSPRLVVEAKRTGTTFRSTRRLSKTEYTLTYAKSAFGPPFSEVLEQAARYAREQCVPYAVLTTGAEWLLVQVIASAGRSADDLKCFYFGNILRDDANIDLLWDLLSHEAVASGTMGETLAEANTVEASFVGNARAELGDLSWTSALSTNTYLDDFYHLFFDQIIDPARRNMLDRCFVTNSRLDQYEGTLKRVLRDTAPKYIDSAQEITPDDRESILRANYGDQAGRVVLVTGSVGCGKSTFVTKVFADLRQRKTARALLVDLIDDVDGPSDELSTMLWKRVWTEWGKVDPNSLSYDDLRKIFHAEIELLKTGAKAKIFQASSDDFDRAEAETLDRLTQDHEAFLTRCIRYYHKQLGIGTTIFLDNVDRASEAFQKLAYSFAHRLARVTGATVIVPLREMTFFRGKAAGFLDIRAEHAVFHLQAPDLVQVLSRRIQYIETHLNDDPRIKEWRRRGDLEDSVNAYKNFSETLKVNLLSSADGKRVIEVLSAFAWHDVRSFLSSVKHLHTALGGTGKWTVNSMVAPLMTTRSASTAQRLPNLFRPPYPAYSTFFIKIRILAGLLYSMSAEKVRQGVGLQALLGLLRVYGYNDRWSRRAIEELVQERMLECLEAPAAAEFVLSYRLREGHDSFRPSPLAVVLFETLQFERPYLALLGQDLPFHDQRSYVDYTRVMKEFVGAVGSQDLGPDALSLLLESGAPTVVADYLSMLFFREQPVVDLSKYAPEVGAIEARVVGALSKMGVEMRDRASQSDDSKTSATAQLPLLPDDEPRHDPGRTFIPLPADIRRTIVHGSQSVAAVFWSLVALKAQGSLWSTGADIARVMNQHLFSDQDKKEPTNISRALRGSTLRAQRWLSVSGTKGAWKYGLAATWEEDWRSIFGQDPPHVGSYN